MVSDVIAREHVRSHASCSADGSVMDMSQFGESRGRERYRLRPAASKSPHEVHLQLSRQVRRTSLPERRPTPLCRAADVLQFAQYSANRKVLLESYRAVG